MKKSTRIFLIFLPIWFMLFLAVSLYNTTVYAQSAGNRINYPVTIKLDGEMCTIPIRADVDVVVFGQKYDNSNIKVNVKPFKGISIVESDTAAMITVKMNESWAKVLSPRVQGGALQIDYDPTKIVKAFTPEGIDTCYYRFNVKPDNYIIATVIMPRGKLKVVAGGNTIYLDSIRSPQISAQIFDRLVLNDCNIDTLRLLMGSVKELKLDRSKVEQVYSSQGNLNVTLASPDAEIGTIIRGSVPTDSVGIPHLK